MNYSYSFTLPTCRCIITFSSICWFVSLNKAIHTLSLLSQTIFKQNLAEKGKLWKIYSHWPNFCTLSHKARLLYKNWRWESNNNVSSALGLVKRCTKNRKRANFTPLTWYGISTVKEFHERICSFQMKYQVSYNHRMYTDLVIQNTLWNLKKHP